ncbi:hypothetical protein M422DRAFT_26487 [Sphaerobolus stellatus SS14]|nr:hypothetical protein M422DRAFT_26487 [Sphaerobolus stellatus SS14]
MTDIHFRRIGDDKVRSPGFGAMSLSHVYGRADDEASKELLRHALKLGITFWDTADMYGCGHNETLIGSVLKEGDNRSKVFLATKFGQVFDRQTLKRTGEVRGDAAYVRQCAEESIVRLGTTPDLFYQHRVDPNVSLEETYSTLEELRKEGKFKYIGISECSAETLRKASKVAKISAVQIEYSPWTTDIERNGLLDAARELGVTVVAYSPLGRGFLTGTIKSPADLAPGDVRSAFPRFAEENFKKNYKVVEVFEGIANRKGVTSAQLCLAWLAAQGDDIIPIPGTKTTGRLEENWKSRDLKLTEEDIKEIRKAVDEANIQGTRYPAPAMAKVEL